MKKVMFVCMGNICRSPLAHAIFEEIVNQNGQAENYLVDSSGTMDYHIGEKADPRMGATALSHSFVIDHRAQHLILRHLKEFDLIICMDSDNRSHALSLATNETERNKICLLRDFDLKSKGDVPDPYYGGDEGFERVYRIVKRSCETLFEKLEETNND